MRFRSFVALSAVAVLAIPTSASAGAPVGEATQTVSGTVRVPNPTKAAQNVSRHIRSAGLAGSSTNGVFGWFFKVDTSTIGGEFTLSSADAGADYDVIFYADPGSLEVAPTASAEYLGAVGSGERGVVPADTTHVMVYPAAGANTTFSYVGHKPATVNIGTGSLDVTVVPGATVTWVNQTADYSFVRGGLDGFDSGSGVGRGMPIGSTFSYSFGDEGTFAYSTSAGTGTVTVAAP